MAYDEQQVTINKKQEIKRQATRNKQQMTQQTASNNQPALIQQCSTGSNRLGNASCIMAAHSEYSGCIPDGRP